MSQNTKSDSSKERSILSECISELLEMQDKARNLIDLVQSLKVQKAIIEAILILLED